jgi:hypothetical protein
MEKQGGKMNCCGKAVEFAKSMGAWVESGMLLLDAEGVNHRITLCRACPHFNGHLCAKCGCLIAMKTRLTTSTCPEGKW